MSDYQDSSDDDEFDQNSPEFKPSFILIAIDTHPVMFAELTDEQGNISTPFREAIKACYALADFLLTSESSKSYNPFCVVIKGLSSVVVPFENNILETVQSLQEILNLPIDQLQERYETKGSTKLSETLLVCRKSFQSKRDYSTRRFLFITNDDCPVTEGPEKFACSNEIRACRGNDITFQVVPMVESFRFETFYNELYEAGEMGTVKEEICLDSEGLMQKLSRLVSLKLSERKVNFYPFKGDYERFFMCKRMSLFRKVNFNQKSYTKSGQQVLYLEVEGESPEYYYVKHSGSNLLLGDYTKEHFKVDKNCLLDMSFSKGLTLMFVADVQAEGGVTVNKPTLLKSDVNCGKKELFKRFWEFCVEKEKVLISLNKNKEVDKLRYVQMMPVLINDEPMFLETRLPFTNEFIPCPTFDYPEEEDDDESNKHRKEIVKEFIDRYTCDFSTDMLIDVVVENKIAHVKAKLLDTKLEKVVLPDSRESATGKLEDVIKAINDRFTLNDKRKRVTGNQSKDGRKQKKVS
ncbi:unnamed protein product [Phyllotreta striolata]|uniref:Uncharacterized protein n=1 Tax=Phyllotreta striolata TaxID=444603 RepID=A0A9N9TLX5_PHYSR|nr:unnamed protein product [Phyllotreta striolata]